MPSLPTKTNQKLPEICVIFFYCVCVCVNFQVPNISNKIWASCVIHNFQTRFPHHDDTQALTTPPAIRRQDALSAVKHLTPMLKQQHGMLYIQWIWPYMYGNIYIYILYINNLIYILCLFMCQSIHISNLCSALEQVCCQPWSDFPWESPTKLWGSSLSSLPFPPVELFSLQ